MSSNAEQSCQLLPATCPDPSSPGESTRGDKTVAAAQQNDPGTKRKQEEQEDHPPIHKFKYHRRGTDPRHPGPEPPSSECHHLKSPSQETTQRTSSSSSCPVTPNRSEHKEPRRIAFLTGSSTPPGNRSQRGGAARTTNTQLDGTQLVCRALRNDDSEHLPKSFSFFTLPAEIRNIIYKLVLHYPDCARLYSVYYQHISSKHRRSDRQETQPQQQFRAYPKNFHAPSLLLLCRRITAECIPILRSHSFVIDRLPPFRLDNGNNIPPRQEDGGARQMKLTDFVGRATLQNLSHIDLRVGVCEGPLGSAWLWKDVVEELYEILSQRNRLATLRLLIRVCDPRAHPAHSVTESEYMRNMAIIIIEVWKIDKQRAIFEWGRILEPPHSSHPMEEQQDRLYPDREMFPGSITEFLKPLPPPFFQE